MICANFMGNSNFREKYLHIPRYTIVTDPLKEEFLISSILRNNELCGMATSAARYGELTGRELSMLEYRASDIFGGMFDKETVYRHTLHPIGVLFDRVRYKNMVFIPRGNLRICVQCVMDDVKILGVAFIHRTHVTPGLLVCHLHAVALLEACPVCHVDIKRHRINQLSACMNRKNNIKIETSLDSTTHRYSQFVYDILNKTDSEKYRLHSIQTMDRSLKNLGYSSSSTTSYLQACMAADKKIGIGTGVYQRARKNNSNAAHTPMQVFTRVAYLLYGTLENFIYEIEEFITVMK